MLVGTTTIGRGRMVVTRAGTNMFSKNTRTSLSFFIPIKDRCVQEIASFGKSSEK